MAEVIAKPYKLAVSQIGDIVQIELICGDTYAANVLYDDILDRLQAGEGLTLTADQGPLSHNKDRRCGDCGPR